VSADGGQPTGSDLRLGERPSGLPTADLAATFDRGARLRGRLAPRPQATPPAPPVSPSPEPQQQPAMTSETAEVDTAASINGHSVEPQVADGEHAPTAPRRSTRGKSRRKTENAQEESPKTRGVVVYVPVSIRERMQARRRADDITHSDLVLDAIEAAIDQLPKLLDSQVQQRSSGLFIRAAATRPGKRSRGEPSVQVWLGLDAANLATIDKLSEEMAQGNRSRLIATALDAYLQPA